MTNPIICPNCEGDGERENRKGETVECVSCKGEGVLREIAAHRESKPAKVDISTWPGPPPVQYIPYSPPQFPGYDIWCGVNADDVTKAVVQGGTGEPMRL